MAGAPGRQGARGRFRGTRGGRGVGGRGARPARGLPPLALKCAAYCAQRQSTKSGEAPHEPNSPKGEYAPPASEVKSAQLGSWSGFTSPSCRAAEAHREEVDVARHHRREVADGLPGEGAVSKQEDVAPRREVVVGGEVADSVPLGVAERGKGGAATRGSRRGTARSWRCGCRGAPPRAPWARRRPPGTPNRARRRGWGSASRRATRRAARWGARCHRIEAG